MINGIRALPNDADKVHALRAIAAIPEGDKAIVTAHIWKILTGDPKVVNEAFKYTPYRCRDHIAQFVEIPAIRNKYEERQREILQGCFEDEARGYIATIVAALPSDVQKVCVLEEFAKIPKNQINQVAKNLSQTDKFEDILKIVMESPAVKRTSMLVASGMWPSLVLNDVVDLIGQVSDDAERVCVLETIAKIQEDVVGEVVQVIAKMPNNDRSRLLKAIAANPGEGICNALISVQLSGNDFVVNKAREIIQKLPNDADKVHALRAITEIPKDQRAFIIRFAEQFPKDQRAFIIGFAEKFPEDDRVAIIELVEQLFSKKDRFFGFRFICEIPDNQRASIIKFAEQLPEKDRVFGLRIICEIPDNQRASIIKFAEQLPEKDRVFGLGKMCEIPDNQRAFIIKFVEQLPEEDRASGLGIIRKIAEDQRAFIIEFAEQFPEDNRVAAIEVIEKFPKDDRVAIIEFVEQLPENDRVNGLSIIREIAYDQRASLIEFAKQLPEDDRVKGLNIICSFYDDDQRASIIEFVEQLPEEDRASGLDIIRKIADEQIDFFIESRQLPEDNEIAVIEFAKQLPKRDRVAGLDIICRFPVNQRASIIEYIRGFSVDDRGRVLKAIFTIPENQRANVIDLLAEIGKEDRLPALEAFARFPENQRASIIRQVGGFSVDDRGRVLKAIFTIPENQRANMIDLLAEIGKEDRLPALEAFARFPENQRASIIRHVGSFSADRRLEALKVISKITDRQREDIIALVADISELRRVAALWTIMMMPESQRDTVIKLVAEYPKDQRDTVIRYVAPLGSLGVGELERIRKLPDNQRDKLLRVLAEVYANYFEEMKISWTIYRYYTQTDQGENVIDFLAQIPAKQRGQGIEALSRIPSDLINDVIINSVLKFADGLPVTEKIVAFEYIGNYMKSHFSLVDRIDTIVTSVSTLIQFLTQMPIEQRIDGLKAVCAMNREEISIYFALSDENRKLMSEFLKIPRVGLWINKALDIVKDPKLELDEKKHALEEMATMASIVEWLGARGDEIPYLIETIPRCMHHMQKIQDKSLMYDLGGLALEHFRRGIPFPEPIEELAAVLERELPENRSSLIMRLGGLIVNDGESLQISVSRADISKYPCIMLNALARQIQINPKPLYVHFLSEAGVDAGGLSREFIFLLWDALKNAVPLRSCDNGLYTVFDEKFEKSKSVYQNLGVLLAFCFNARTDRPLPIGMIFDQSVFIALTEIAKVLREGKDLTDFDALFNIYVKMKARNENDKRAADEIKKVLSLSENKIEDYLVNVLLEEPDKITSPKSDYQKSITDAYIVPQIAPLIEITRGMPSATRVDISRMDPVTFSERVQGVVTREKILESIEFSKEITPEQKKWIESWIKTTSDENVKNFLYALTGSPALGAKPLKIQKSTTNLIFHTCFNSLDLPVDQGLLIKFP